MEARTLHRRLIAVLVGIACAVAVVAVTFLVLPAQGAHDETKDYGYVYSGAKSSSVDFLRASMGDDSLLMLGSSEFSTPASSVPQIPKQVFGTTNYGVRLMLVGEAFDQCLWDAIALGALADGGLPRGKVAIFVGLGQFTDGGLDNASFGERFSFSLYQAFCANDAIPQEQRDYVRKRLEEQGIDEATLDAADPKNPIAAIDGAVLGAMDDLKLRKDLIDVRASAIDLAGGEAEAPNWPALRAWALEDAKRMSTTNDWGAEDKFYTTELEPALPALEGARADETYTNTPEYDDLKALLSICDACRIEPLVVISPSMGHYYDYIGISAYTRQAAYERIRDIVRNHVNAKMADFSNKEYERYFLFDIVHYGWTGWIDVEQALYEFAIR